MYVVPVAWIRHVADELGHDSPVLTGALRAAGLGAGALADGVRVVRARHFVDFVEAAARLARDDLFGLSLGRSYDLRASGLAAYVAISAANLREAMENAARYGALTDTAADFGVSEADGAARFRMDSRSGLVRASRHATEFRVGFVVASCRRWVGAGFGPLEVRFTHERESGRDRVEAFLGCPAEFGCETTEMLLSPGQLALPVSAADPYLLALLEQHAEQVLAGRGQPRDGLRERVARLVAQDLPKGAPTARRVASALGMSERTFARRLQAEGTSFRQLMDDIRRDMARSYLSDPELTLAQVGYLLGYADQSAFSNSFRRWTGQSPRRFRSERFPAAAVSAPA
jgi:AraC-like DNA-binding protein